MYSKVVMPFLWRRRWNQIRWPRKRIAKRLKKRESPRIREWGNFMVL
jgi:hypothetical protein